MPTVKEINDQLDGFNDEQRVELLAPLMEKLSPPSIGELMNFQHQWDGTRPYEEFVTAQNQVIHKCLELECSGFGSEVRKAAGLEPLDWETEIAPAEKQ